MSNNTIITKALIALIDKQIGIREAATLFACQGGLTQRDLAAKLGTTMQNAKSRISSLRQKGLLAMRYELDGTAHYEPSPRGAKLINSVCREIV